MKRTERWQRAIAPYTRTAPDADPATSALLVIDMQRYFAAMAEPIVESVLQAIATCRALDVPVIFTRHGHVDPATDGGMLGAWWGELIVEGTSDHALIPALGASAEDTIVAKRRYDAFFGTELEQVLRQKGVSDLALAGVMTNLCVETTARTAFVRDFRVRVLLDATATVTDELHLASLRNLAFGFAHVQTTRDWCASLRARATPRGTL
jgi:nicotinamidase-related amidase